jgi:hypothetical protein
MSNWINGLAQGVAMTVLCGCAAPSTAPLSVADMTAAPTPLTTQTSPHHQALLPIAIAQALAGGCKAVRLDRDAQTATEDAVRAGLLAQGYTRREAKQIMASVDAAAQRTAIAAYARGMALDLKDAHAVCRTARAEMTEGSAVGRHLTERG